MGSLLPRAACDELDAWLCEHYEELAAAMLADPPQVGSHTWDLLESPEPLGRMRGALMWLESALASQQHEEG